MGLKELGDKALESKFVCGLKEEIQSEMHKLNPMGLKAKMTMAQLIEDDQAIQQKKNKVNNSSPSSKSSSSSSGSGSSRSNACSFTFSPSRNSSASSTTITPIRETNAKFADNAPPYHRLTEEEMQIKKEKGICFKCDGTFSFGHR